MALSNMIALPFLVSELLSFYKFFSDYPCAHHNEVTVCNIWPRWLSWMHRLAGDQEVAGSAPAEVGNILLWRLIMKYFLWSFSPFR